MRPLRALVLSLAATSAVATAEKQPVDVSLPEEGGGGEEPFSSLIVALIEQFQQSSDMLWSFFSPENQDADVEVRLVVIDAEEPNTMQACLKAMAQIHKSDELESPLGMYFRSAVDVVSSQLWGETSCGDLEYPDLIEQCNRVLRSVDFIRKFLQDGKTDDEVCDIVVNVVALESNDDLSCKLCQHLVQMVDNALTQEVQQIQQVRVLIEDMCDLMSPDSMCHAFLKNYDAIVDWLKHGTDPLVVCTQIAMCYSDNDSSNQIADVVTSPEELELADSEVLVAQNIFEEDQSCFFCTHVTGILYQANTSELLMLKSLLGNVCDVASMDSKCLDVDEDIDRIVELVQQGQNPREVCESRDFCPMTSTRRGVSSLDSDDKTCVYCDAATTVVEVILQEAPDEIDQIRDYADMICNLLGEDSPCHEYVNKLDAVIDGLKKGMHPREICKSLHYCPAGHSDDALVEAYLPPSQDKCSFCSRMAGVIHQANEFPEELSIVETVLSSACVLVPSMCIDDVIDAKYGKIVEMVKQGLYPYQICKSLGVCSEVAEDTPSIGKEMKGLVLATQWAPGNETECTYCQFATTVAKIALQQYSADINQVRLYADMICGMLGVDNPCHIYVKELDFVIDSIAKGMSSKAICTQLEFCPAIANEQLLSANSKDIVHDEKHTPNHHGCSFCIHLGVVIHHVQKIEPEKLPIVKTILTDACKLAPSDCKCDELLQDFDKIVEMEKAGTRPVEICKIIGFCHKKVDVVLGTYSFADVVSSLALVSRSGFEGETKTCFICTYVTMLVQVEYAEDATEIAQIKELADSACALLGDESGCHEYVAKLDFVLNSLKEGTHPRAICESMDYCSPEKSMRDTALLSSGSALSETNSSSVETKQELMDISFDGCFYCTQMASVIEVAIAEDPSKISQIRQIADVICRMLPSDNQCHSFVKQFDTVVDSIKKGEQPKAICHDLNYCKVEYHGIAERATPSADLVALQTSRKGSATCAYCSGIVTVLKYAIEQSPDQVTEMREAAGIVCEILPADDTCHDDLKMFDQAVTDLKAGEQPQAICQTLKFCQAAAGSLDGLVDFTGADFLPSKCTTCQQQTSLLASLIPLPDSLATFKREINSVCKLIPEAGECELLMKHEDSIVQLLRENENVESICVEIGECGPAAETVKKSMSVGCLFCEYTADLLKYAADNEKVLREAKTMLEIMCTVLPPLARCDALTSKFDQLVLLMREGKTPREACDDIAMCDLNFVQSSDDEEAILQAFKTARQSMDDMMEIQ